jgi:hypothetical protein
MNAYMTMILESLFFYSKEYETRNMYGGFPSSPGSPGGRMEW